MYRTRKLSKSSKREEKIKNFAFSVLKKHEKCIENGRFS